MSRRITVLYATVSGNAETLAGLVADRLKAAGHVVDLRNLADLPAERLAGLERVAILASTWGDGEPPPESKDFCDALANGGMPRLDKLRYAVLGLGSSSYRDFCGCARRIDEDLARCGAVRLLERVDCDVKFKADFERWLAGLESALGADR